MLYCTVTHVVHLGNDVIDVDIVNAEIGKVPDDSEGVIVAPQLVALLIERVDQGIVAVFQLRHRHLVGVRVVGSNPGGWVRGQQTQHDLFHLTPVCLQLSGLVQVKVGLVQIVGSPGKFQICVDRYLE